MRKYYTDQERYEWCRKYKISGKTVREFALENGLCRETLRDWINAYNNIHGKFINVTKVAEKENNLIESNDISVNILMELDYSKYSGLLLYVCFI